MENEKDLTTKRLWEIKNAMGRVAMNTETESAHASADDLLCEALRLLGQHELVEMYETVDKWYA